MSTFTIRVTSSAVNTAGTGFGQQPDLGTPSYLDMVVTNSTDPLLPNGTYDAYCLHPLKTIFFSPTTYSAENLVGNAETSFDPIGMSSITQTQLDQLNWLLSQNFTSDAKYGGAYNYGEVQIAIWKILGFTDAQIASIDARFLNDNNRNTVVSAEANFLVSAAQAAIASGNGVLPTNAWFSTIIDPAGDAQPLIIQLQSAKLGNFVWLDSDADGIQDAGEQGVDNVIVELYDGNGNLISTTKTGDDYSTAAVEKGYYQFAGLAAGNYQVKFIPTGDLQITTQNANANSQDAVDSDANVATGFSQVVTLAAGESNQTIDAGLIQPAKISGYVYCDDDNDGVRDAGEVGLPGVTVRLTGTNDLGQSVSTTTTTDSNGFYQFTGLRPGTYTVTELTQPADKLDGKDTAGSTGGTAGNEVISNIPLAAGQSSENNNFGEILPATISGSVYCDDDNDGVREAGEVGLSGVTITLTGTDDLGVLINRTTTTDSNGFYQFTGLRPGTYTVTEATQPDGKLDGKDTAGTPGGGTAGNEVISNITLTPGMVSSNNNFGEILPAKISGYVYEDVGNDGVRNAEPAIANVTITLTGTDDRGNAVNLTTTTNAAGYYEFANLRPGSYTVNETQPAGFADGKDTAGTTGGTAGNDVINAIPLAAGQHSQENNFGELKPATSEIRGFVYCDDDNDGIKDAGEIGLQGVTVTLTGTNDLGQAVNLTTTTGADGSYAFTGLRAGTYTVTEATQPADKLDGKDTAGSLGGSTAVNEVISGIVLGTNQVSSNNNFGEILPAKISGYVYEDKGDDGARTGDPAIAGVTVKLTGTNDLGQAVSLTTTTNGSGYYEFANLRPGTYTVNETQPAGFLDGKDTAGTTGGTAGNDVINAIPLAAGQHSQENNFGELKAATIGNKVWLDCDMDGQQDAGEPGVAGVTVNLLNSAGMVVGTTTTNANGDYQFTNLRPGTYSVEFVKLTGYSFTTRDAAANDIDSDADVTTGRTVTTFLDSGETDLTWDAGLTAPKQCLTFDFSGNTGVSGAFGNMRTYTNNGVSVNVTAFSRDKATGAFATAYLGAYGGGLGVTDSSESGAGDTHTVDNVGRDNYVMFTFNQSVTLDSAFLGYVVGDSDIQVWIGNFAGAFSTPLSLNSSVLGSMGFTELNSTTLTTARLADLNAGEFAGNVIVIAADTTDTSPEDNFKLEKLNVCTVPCAPPPPPTACIGDRVWHDRNANGIQDAGEEGIGGVTVQLRNAQDMVIATTVTNSSGIYEFKNVNPGDYSVSFLTPAGYLVTKANQGANDAADSDVTWVKVKGTTNLVDNGSFETSSNWISQLGKWYGMGDKMEINTGSAYGVTGVTGSKVLELDANTTYTKTGIYQDIKTVAGQTYELSVDVAMRSGTSSSTNSVEVWWRGSRIATIDPTSTALKTYTFTVTGSGGNDRLSFQEQSGDDNGLGGIIDNVRLVTCDTVLETALTTLTAGECDTSWDAGFYKKAAIGDKVWEDADHDGLQDSWEAGICNVKVTLQSLVNGVISNVAVTYTDVNGNYNFTNLDPGTYRLVFDKSNTYYKNTWMGYWYWGKKDVGSNDAIDADAYSTGNTATTDWTVLESGEVDKSWDAAITPIIIDLNGDGVQTIARANAGGTFDLFGNGKAIASGWVSAEDGMLAVDKNGNGTIDSIHELFGGSAKGAGFASLAAYDSNADGVVDARDAGFSDLRIWQDANGNHVTDAGELMTLARAGVASLKVAYVEVPEVDAQGNLHLERSSATMADGRQVDMTDVYFSVSEADAADAGVTLPSIGELLGHDRSLDSMLGMAVQSATAQPVEAAAAESSDASEVLRRLAALQAEQAQPAMAA